MLAPESTPSAPCSPKIRPSPASPAALFSASQPASSPPASIYNDLISPAGMKTASSDKEYKSREPKLATRAPNDGAEHLLHPGQPLASNSPFLSTPPLLSPPVAPQSRTQESKTPIASFSPASKSAMPSEAPVLLAPRLEELCSLAADLDEHSLDQVQQLRRSNRILEDHKSNFSIPADATVLPSRRHSAPPRKVSNLVVGIDNGATATPASLRNPMRGAMKRKRQLIAQDKSLMEAAKLLMTMKLDQHGVNSTTTNGTANRTNGTKRPKVSQNKDTFPAAGNKSRIPLPFALVPPPRSSTIPSTIGTALTGATWTCPVINTSPISLNMHIRKAVRKPRAVPAVTPKPKLSMLPSESITADLKSRPMRSFGPLGWAPSMTTIDMPVQTFTAASTPTRILPLIGNLYGGGLSSGASASAPPPPVGGLSFFSAEGNIKACSMDVHNDAAIKAQKQADPVITSVPLQLMPGPRPHSAGSQNNYRQGAGRQVQVHAQVPKNALSSAKKPLLSPSSLLQNPGLNLNPNLSVPLSGAWLIQQAAAKVAAKQFLYRPKMPFAVKGPFAGSFSTPTVAFGVTGDVNWAAWSRQS